jgi:hypothetical protein
VAKATGAEVVIAHVAGPWEPGWGDDGNPVEMQRCLRCDAELSARRTEHQERTDPGWRIGARVGISGPILLDLELPEAREYEQQDCRCG